MVYDDANSQQLLSCPANWNDEQLSAAGFFSDHSNAIMWKLQFYRHWHTIRNQEIIGILYVFIPAKNLTIQGTPKQGGIMKKLTISLAILVLLLGSIFICQNAMAESKTKQYLGEPEMCLDTYRIDETRIIDNQTILFIMRGGERYLNRLPVPCSGLVIADGFGYTTSISKLCLQDRITTLSPGSAPANTCMLGKFIPFNVDMTDGDAIKLLKDGLLDELVAEEAFEETF